ncbi:MAG: YdbL family protein [Azospirillaceae bacterium]
MVGNPVKRATGSGRQDRRQAIPSDRRGVGRRAVLAGAGALLGLAAVGLGLPRSARAQNLDQARAQGLVGERRDGYVGVVSPGSGVESLVESVNARRRDEYRRIADDTGVPLAVVEQRAAEQLISRLPSGQYYMNANGQWARK